MSFELIVKLIQVLILFYESECNVYGLSFYVVIEANTMHTFDNLQRVDNAV